MSCKNLGKLVDTCIPSHPLRSYRYIFDLNWPNMPQEPRPNHLSIVSKKRMLALLLSSDPKNLEKLNLILTHGLVDFERPIYDSLNGVYLNLISFMIENEKSIENGKFDVILSYYPKQFLNHPDSNGVTPLDAAILKGNVEIVAKLIKAGGFGDFSSSFH